MKRGLHGWLSLVVALLLLSGGWLGALACDCHADDAHRAPAATCSCDCTCCAPSGAELTDKPVITAAPMASCPSFQPPLSDRETGRLLDRFIFTPPRT